MQDEVASLYAQLQHASREASQRAAADDAERERLAGELGQCRLLCSARGRQLEALQGQLGQVGGRSGAGGVGGG